MGYLFRAHSTSELDKMLGRNYYRLTSYLPWDRHFNHIVDVERTDSWVLPISRTNDAGLGLRREWKDIRAQQSSIYMLWFPLHGELSITQDQQFRTITHVDEFVITYGDRPFDIRTNVDREGRATQIQVAIPSHILRSRLPLVDKLCGRPFPAEHGLPLISKEIFSRLIDEAEQVPTGIAERLSFTALDSLTETVQSLAAASCEPPLWRTHLDRAFAYIDDHFQDAELTGSEIATACGYSRRYLHYLLKRGNLSLKDYLVSKRLALAAQHLNDPEFAYCTASDIAYTVGFRNPATFKAAYTRLYGPMPNRPAKASERAK